MALRQLLRRGATVASVVIPTSQRAVACPVVASLVREKGKKREGGGWGSVMHEREIHTLPHHSYKHEQRYVSSTSVTQLPLDGSKMPSATESEEEEGREPSGTPWTPAPVAEDYEETIQILLESHKVEDALDIFGRMIKRGFRPSSNITDELYAVAKTKPEWQAAAVKALDGLP